MGGRFLHQIAKKPNRLYAIFIGLVIAETIFEDLIIKNKIPKTKKLNLY